MNDKYNKLFDEVREIRQDKFDRQILQAFFREKIKIAQQIEGKENEAFDTRLFPNKDLAWVALCGDNEDVRRTAVHELGNRFAQRPNDDLGEPELTQ